MSVITHVPEPNIWDEICKEFASKRPPFKDDDERSVHTVLDDYDPAVVTPVFFGPMNDKIEVDDKSFAEFDAAVSHPACVGYSFVNRPPASPPPPQIPPPNSKTCTPREYLEHYVFPVLLPGLEQMLHQAKKEKCFERKRTKFNALDFLTEYLYRKNPDKEGRDDVTLAEIPFVQECWKDNPRPPLPMSLLWNEEEAALIVQSFWRGYKARLDPEIQELRQWQKEWREEQENINNKVDEFWAKKMPENTQTQSNMQETSNTSQTPGE